MPTYVVYTSTGADYLYAYLVYTYEHYLSIPVDDLGQTRPLGDHLLEQRKAHGILSQVFLAERPASSA